MIRHIRDKHGEALLHFEDGVLVFLQIGTTLDRSECAAILRRVYQSIPILGVGKYQIDATHHCELKGPDEDGRYWLGIADEGAGTALVMAFGGVIHAPDEELIEVVVFDRKPPLVKKPSRKSRKGRKQ